MYVCMYVYIHIYIYIYIYIYIAPLSLRAASRLWPLRLRPRFDESVYYVCTTVFFPRIQCCFTVWAGVFLFLCLGSFYLLNSGYWTSVVFSNSIMFVYKGAVCFMNSNMYPTFIVSCQFELTF